MWEDVVAPLLAAGRDRGAPATGQLGAAAVCALLGHERWTNERGDWVCMRCGKTHHVPLPQFPARSSR